MRGEDKKGLNKENSERGIQRKIREKETEGSGESVVEKQEEDLEGEQQSREGGWRDPRTQSKIVRLLFAFWLGAIFSKALLYSVGLSRAKF